MGCSLPRFFQPFLPQHCSQNLRIPDAFVDRITGKVPSRVIIKNHVGKLWPVEVVQTEDGFYFQGGWSKFVFDNSLQIGEFLVFKYNGHHVFEVLVLGINGCVKEVIVLEGKEGGRGQVDDGEEMVRETSRNSDNENLSADQFISSKSSSVLSTTPKKLKKSWTKDSLSTKRTTQLSTQK